MVANDNNVQVYENFLKNYPTLLEAVKKRAATSQNRRGRSPSPGPSARDKAANTGTNVQMDLSPESALGLLTSYDFIGHVIVLRGLLKMCMYLSTEMQKVNAIPWELYDSQRALVSRLRAIQLALSDTTEQQRRDTGDIILASVFPEIYETADSQGQHPGTFCDMLQRGEFMGQKLVVSAEDTISSDDESANVQQALLSLSYEVSDWAGAAAHWYEARFISDEHGMLKEAAKCMDLRIFAAKNPVFEDSWEHHIQAAMKPSLQTIYDWIVDAGVLTSPPPFSTVLSEGVALASLIQSEVKSFYENVVSHRSAHRWHVRQQDGSFTVKSGTVIQKDILTRPCYYQASQSYIFLYQHMVLKIVNESVVESMCSVVAKHAAPGRGLSFGKYAAEAIIKWNLPAAHKADAFISEGIDTMFHKRRGVSHLDSEVEVSRKKRWRFHHTDKKNRMGVTYSAVIDRKLKETSKFEFME